MNAKESLINTSEKTCSFRVQMELDNKVFLKTLFPENGVQGYLYNLLVIKLREAFAKEKIYSYNLRLSKTGTLRDLVDNLEIKIKTKNETN